jgi:hypothetical protein
MEIKQAEERNIPLSLVKPCYDEMFHLIGVDVIIPN